MGIDTAEWQDEFGVFSDEGCLEAGFYSREAAEHAATHTYAECNATVHAMCPDHPEQPYDGCEMCEDG